jgi:acyl-coenzyme A thioesterase PaaI-like protein
MGITCSQARSQISIRFLRPVPLGVDTVVRAEIDQIDGRKVHVRGAILSSLGEGQHGGLYAKSSGTFIQVDLDRYGQGSNPIRFEHQPPR